MEKYSYELDGQIIQVATVEEVPAGLPYETIQFELRDTKEEEIEALRQKTRLEISSLIFEYTQRNSMRGIPIPEEITAKYEEMRANYQLKKLEIINRL